MEITIKDNKIILVLGTTIHEINTWIEVEKILKEHLEKKGK